jgi:LPXTG-motif cell wall-anchored protein
MGRTHVMRRGIAVLGIAAGSLLLTAPAALAVDPPKPSASCKIPSLSAIPETVTPGSVVTVSGQNFSGCPAEGDPTPPTAVLQVKIGIATDQKMGQILATTQTAADGSFSTSVTIPAVASAGDKIALAAGTQDVATGLAYAAVVPLLYSGGTTVPTGVPAGTGGLLASESDTESNLLTVVGGAGLVLAGAGVAGLRRRRVSSHS